jgi:hypothetical protein
VKCVCCGNETDYFCETCDEPVCDDCTKGYDQFSQITEIMCMPCYNGYESNRADHFIEEERREKARQIKREHRNSLARIRYKRPENIEKRRIKKEIKEQQRIKREQEHAKDVRKLLSNIFKHM